MLKYITAFIICFISSAQANVWDNLWSNNQNNRVVFPEQFELKLSWNATVKNQMYSNFTTNYVQTHIKIDQATNRVMTNANFSTLSLAPHELIGFILDFEQKQIYIKQNKSCIYYDLVTKISEDAANSELEGLSGDSWFNFQINEFPNIQQLFDLFPYLFRQTQMIEIDGKLLKEFRLEQPISIKGFSEQDKDIDLLAYFDAETMDLDRFVYRDNRPPSDDEEDFDDEKDFDADDFVVDPKDTHISDLINGVDRKTKDQRQKEEDKKDDSDQLKGPRHYIPIYAPQPITKMKFSPEDMEFKNVDCIQATEAEQNKLYHYVQRIIDQVTLKRD